MSTVARLLRLLIRERDQLRDAAGLDAENPLPPLDGPDGAGALCRSRAYELWTGWQARDGTPAERERLHREALAELAGTNLYATLAPLLADALAAHSDLADALGEERAPDLERHGKALAALGTHLPAIAAALAGRPPSTKDGCPQRRRRKHRRKRTKGMPGRRGYSLHAWRFAQKLRKANPQMKAMQIRRECLKQFAEDDLPADADSFRAWLNRPRKRT